MALFKIRALKSSTKEQVKVEFHLGGRNYGYTPEKDFLIVETQSTDSYKWYATYNDKRIGFGTSSGGIIEIEIPID